MNSPRIILLAHGSSDKRWRTTFEELAAPTLASVDGARVAYMELAEPSMDTVIREGVTEGITEFTIIPLFLAAGRHLRKDVPEMIKELEQSHGASIQLTGPIGESPLLGQAIRDIVRDQLEETTP
ncbi:sirohydrochlorin chelatase [Marinobacter sp. F3R08]|uniref:sirohydrochlorin chelatase n=1 Tax=Marinobacter sp. F3R08 TaxID=2841559 RepID=UPI001C087270|nr:CbiX/SirB N-terminal domain-containing protein [Marinobacter sp. F3R08]MBU2952548.1 CbiX/SirB N-terminal domain-containing protein [Marinobacter sp. F3R08]